MISVIVPVYKVEEYLDKCVQSILLQTYSDFELILVDDGSPDSCPQICDNYAKRYTNVVVIHKENGGLSDARNAGTMIAKGDYITFIDSDDYVSEDYLMTLISLQKENNADIVVTGLAVFKEGTKPDTESDGKVYCYSNEQALESMLYQDTLDTSACAMLLPAAIAQKYQFPIGKYHEDEFTTYKYYSAANRVIVTTQKQYFYLQRAGSIMHTFGQSSLDELDAADNLVTFCEKHYPQLTAAAKSKKFSDYCQVLLSNKDIKATYPDVYARICGYLDNVKFDIMRDKKCRSKNRIAAIALFGGTRGLLALNYIKKKAGAINEQKNESCSDNAAGS